MRINRIGHFGYSCYQTVRVAQDLISAIEEGLDDGDDEASSVKLTKLGRLGNNSTLCYFYKKAGDKQRFQKSDGARSRTQ